MSEANAGTVPVELPETTVMTVWPSLAVYTTGRLMGTLMNIQQPGFYIFRLGNLFAILCIPWALVLYFWRVLPWVGIRYRLTNRRIIIGRGLSGAASASLALDAFDTIDVDVRPGQAWFRAGDLVFRQAGAEVFRLVGVSCPEPFRQTCLKTRQALVTVNPHVLRQAG